MLIYIYIKSIDISILTYFSIFCLSVFRCPRGWDLFSSSTARGQPGCDGCHVGMVHHVSFKKNWLCKMLFKDAIWGIEPGNQVTKIREERMGGMNIHIKKQFFLHLYMIIYAVIGVTTRAPWSLQITNHLQINSFMNCWSSPTPKIKIHRPWFYQLYPLIHIHYLDG